jgi:uncharacterized protein (TIGR00369 family)
VTGAATSEDALSQTVQAPGETGIAYLRRLMANEGAAPLGVMLGFRLIAVEEGVAVFEGRPSPAYFNPRQIMHGGWTATLLDSALGCAIHTKLGADIGYGTIDLKVHYIRAITLEMPRVICRGDALHVGRRTATSQARVESEDGKLLAHATCTCLIGM